MAKVVVVGAGPVGLYFAIMRARAGDEVSVVDRDAGPGAGGNWARRGLMQFHHPHFFRPVVRQVFDQTAPDLWDAVVAAGGIPARPPGAPESVTGLQSRRSTFERAIRAVAEAEAGVTLRTGHAQSVEVTGGRVTGLVLDGAPVEADVVVDATGRAGRLSDNLRPAGEGGPCGFSYVSRMYRVLDDQAAAQLAAASLPMGRLYDGYLVIIFPQDARTLSALIVRASDDEDLALLRHRPAYEAAIAAIPHLAQWTQPGRFEPITGVLPGGGLSNTFRGQPRQVRGLYCIGDSVSTTNPAAGRGVSLGLLQAQALLQLIDHETADAAVALDDWCVQNIKPWYEDHVHWDATLLRRWGGEDLDLKARIPSDIICAAAEVEPSLTPIVTPYLAMSAPPASLQPATDRVRELLHAGWRPPLADGPTRDELAEVVTGMQLVGAAR